MHPFSTLSRPAAVLAALCAVATFAVPVQALAAGAPAAVPVVHAGRNMAVHVSAPAKHRDGDGSQLHARVRDGVYTVDGMVAKVHLNYDIHGATFLYLFVPGVGTAVISAAPMQAALATPVALHLDELTFVVDNHRFMLTGVSMATATGQTPSHLYVHLDRSAWHLNRLPMVGYGDRAELPYQWPGALPADQASDQANESEAVPPIPASLLPRTVPASAMPGQVTLTPASLR